MVFSGLGARFFSFIKNFNSPPASISPFTYFEGGGWRGAGPESWLIGANSMLLQIRKAFARDNILDDVDFNRKFEMSSC